MENLLKIENLKLAFHGPFGRVPAVRGVDFSVDAGETVALVGESGCGKTALCRSILMLHSQHADIEEGRILLAGKDVTGLTEKELESVRGKDAAMVFQDPMSSLNPTFSIGSQITSPMRIHEKIGRREARKKALRLLELVGIDNPEARFSQYPHHFSGGMRQRVAIAIALACNPRLIIADEPTTSLDTATQDRIMELLAKLCRGEDKGLLFVTHDLGLAETIADRIAVMKDGLIVESGKTEEIFQNPQHPYTQKLLGFAKYGKRSSHYHGKVREASEPPQGAEPLVQIEGLTKHFQLGRKTVRTVLKDFDLTVYRGEIVGIVGNSGCGKSTLARCIMGIHEPSGGTITLADGCRKQMIFQDSASAFNPRMTLEQIIAEPLVIKNRHMDRKALQEKVLELMDQVGLERELAGRHPYDVSGGQRQRAAIARALITDPDFIIADEPISSLDVSIQSQIIHLLKRLCDERHLTMLLIAHDRPMVEHVSDRVITMTTL